MSKEEFKIKTKKELKPLFEEGDEVYAAYWKDEDDKKNCSWYPGKIIPPVCGDNRGGAAAPPTVPFVAAGISSEDGGIGWAIRPHQPSPCPLGTGSQAASAAGACGDVRVLENMWMRTLLPGGFQYSPMRNRTLGTPLSEDPAPLYRRSMPVRMPV